MMQTDAPGATRPISRLSAMSRLHAAHRTKKAGAARGFTLIELLIVAAILAILVGVAVPTYRNAQRKARESVLRENLFIMRQTIDQYFADKGYYPLNIETLESEGYIRRLPMDPILGEARWDAIPAPADASLDTAQPPGVYDVKSLANGETLDGVPYGEL